jgi:adenylate cyclase
VPTTRRLAAIMFTDMVGSTASAQVNETEALQLRDEQEDLVRRMLVIHEGREVKTMGDGFLVEFRSALHAVQCAIDIQQHVRQRNSQKDRTPIELRIGIHLGDVEERGTDIVGDSVNIASRLEPLAETGGICVSEPVFGQVHNKIPARFEKLDSPKLKNVRFPMDVYRVHVPGVASTVGGEADATVRVAVLPFANISPDPKDGYFADGLTEEIISELSRNVRLRVIARTSVLRYKDAPRSVEEIGKELRVGVVLEGSVRKAGNRIRITAQLIDSSTQEHLWSEQFDRDLTDIFEVQSEIAKRVAGLLVGRLGEAAPRGRPPTKDLDAYSAYLRARSLWNQRSTESVLEALGIFKQAISKDPAFAQAYSGLADCYSILADRSEITWSDGGPKARAAARRAIELNPDLAEPHASLGLVLNSYGEWDPAEREFQRAIELAPGYASAHQWYFLLLVANGRMEEAEKELAEAEQADPLSPIILGNIAQFASFRGRDDEAVRKWDQAMEVGPGLRDWFLFSKTAFYTRRERLQEAEASLRNLETLLASSGARADVDRIWMPAALHAMLGRKERALQALEMLPTIVQSGQATASEVAAVCAGLGDLDRCYDWLFRSLDALRNALYNIRIHPLYEPIRADARFSELLRRCGVRA